MRGSPSRVARTFHSEGDPSLRSLPLGEWGFGGLLPQILEQAAEIADPVASTSHVLGLGGRVSPDVGVAAMPRRERVLWTYATRAPAAPERVGACWATSAVGVCRDGRVRLGAPVPRRPVAGEQGDIQRDWLPVDRDVARLAAVELDRSTWFAWKEADEQARAAGRYDAACLQAWEAHVSANDGARFAQLLIEVNEVLQQSAPIIWYVDAERFSNFVDENLPGKSLLPASPRNVFRPQGLDEFLAHPVQDRFALLALDLLLRAGGPHRLEERNWTQVRPDDLRAHLTAALERYARMEDTVAGEPAENDDPWRALVELAERALAGRDGLATRRQRYRSISAALLHKREAFADPHCGENAQRLFAQSLQRITRHAIGPRLQSIDDVATYVDSVAKATGPCGRFGTALEEALALSAAAALHAADADVGMTRGHRAPCEIACNVEQQAWDRLAEREQREFYCCVLPHPRILLAAERPRLAESLWAMAARMQFNSWHFLGGNLPSEGATRERDRFIPPKVPDVSAWSDQHHRGHIATGVRFSVRAPAPVEIAQRPFWGFCDIRLLRFSGSPFDELEMMIGLVGARHVARLIEAVIERSRTGGPEVSIEAFRRSFYVSGAFAALVEEVRL